MNINKELLKKALSPLIASIPAYSFQFEFEGEKSDDMSDEEVRELLLNEYSNDKVLEYINNAMQKVLLFETTLYTSLGDIVNEIDTTLSNGIDKSHLRPSLIDELACLIGTYSFETSTFVGRRYASETYQTWLTKTGKIIVTKSYEYGRSFMEQPDYIIRKITNDMSYATANALEELVDEWAKDIWEQ